MWDRVLQVVDAVESWLVLLPLYFQIPILLVVLVPLAWIGGAVIDPVVDWVLRHTERAERPVPPDGGAAP
jgi:hypothetical protein